MSSKHLFVLPETLAPPYRPPQITLEGTFNPYGNGQPWFASDASTGIPIDTTELYPAIANDLQQALDDRIDVYDVAQGQTIFRDFGVVTAIYTCIDSMNMQGTGCTWSVTYVSHGAGIVWFKTWFNARNFSHTPFRTDFTVYPP